MLRAYTLAVKDYEGRNWEFVVKSWANGTEHRRVYVLEQTSLFLRSNCLREGDVIGVCCNEAGGLLIAANTPELREATLRPTYGVAVVRPQPPPAPGKTAPLLTGTPGEGLIPSVHGCREQPTLAQCADSSRSMVGALLADGRQG